MDKNDTLVAINLTNGTKLLNPTKRPILFYWDGTGDLHDEIIGSFRLIETPNDLVDFLRRGAGFSVVIFFIQL